jgi:hypothetical protein
VILLFQSHEESEMGPTPSISLIKFCSLFSLRVSRTGF